MNKGETEKSTSRSFLPPSQITGKYPQVLLLSQWFSDQIAWILFRLFNGEIEQIFDCSNLGIAFEYGSCMEVKND